MKINNEPMQTINRTCLNTPPISSMQMHTNPPCKSTPRRPLASAPLHSSTRFLTPWVSVSTRYLTQTLYLLDCPASLFMRTLSTSAYGGRYTYPICSESIYKLTAYTYAVTHIVPYSVALCQHVVSTVLMLGVVVETAMFTNPSRTHRRALSVPPMLSRVTAVLNIIGNCVVGQGDRNRDDSGGSEPSDNRPSRLSRLFPTPVKPKPHPLPLPIDDVEENGTSPSPSLSSTLPIRNNEAIARALNPHTAICTVYCDNIVVLGENVEQLERNRLTIRSVTSHISDSRLPNPASTHLHSTTRWYMALHPVRELRDVLHALGYDNILELVASSPNLIHDLTSNPMFRASVTRRPSLLYDHIVDNYPDLINETLQYDMHHNDTNPYFNALASVPHLRRALMYDFPHDETDESCRKLIANPDLLRMIESNTSLEQYFTSHVGELELSIEYYSVTPLPPAVHYVPLHPNDAMMTSSSSSSSSSSNSSSTSSSSSRTLPELSDINNPHAMIMLGNADHMRNVIISELHEHHSMYITPMQSGTIAARFNNDDEWVSDIYLDLSILLNALIVSNPATRHTRGQYAPMPRTIFPTPIIYGPNNMPCVIPHSDILTSAEFTLSIRQYAQTDTQRHDRQAHQHILDALYRLIMVNYGRFVLDAIIADTPLLHQLHDNPSYALAFSHDLFAYVRMRNLPAVSMHDNQSYRTSLTNVPSQLMNPLDISHVRVPNDNTHLQHLIALRRELDTHLSYSDTRLLLDIPTVQRLHRDVTYVEFLCNIVNVRRTLVLRSQLNLNLNVDDNYTPVHINPVVPKRPIGHQKNAKASSATSSTASSSTTSSDCPPPVSSRVHRHASKYRPIVINRTQTREWQLLRRYDAYTNRNTIANLCYDTYYTWLSYYNADNYSSDEIVDNDTETDSEIEEVESDYGNDSDSNVSSVNIIPITTQPNHLRIQPNNLDAPAVIPAVIPVVIPAVIPVDIPVVPSRPMYIDLTLRNNISQHSIHTRVFTDPLTPPARNTRSHLAKRKPPPTSPTPKKARPSAQPFPLPTR